MKPKEPKSLLKVVLTRTMSVRDITNLKRLLAYMRQYDRIKFYNCTTPSAYLQEVEKIESLIPNDFKEETYARYELREPTIDDLRFFITALAKRIVELSFSPVIKNVVSEMVATSLYDEPDLSDISSTDSASAL